MGQPKGIVIITIETTELSHTHTHTHTNMFEFLCGSAKQFFETAIGINLPNYLENISFVEW